MTKATQSKEEIESIRSDINSLKSNIVKLTNHIKNDGETHLDHIKHVAEERLDDISKLSQEKYKSVRGTVKNNPEKSIAIAFASGLLASFLIGRR